MLPEAVSAVAAMAGSAVVQAAGTDAWTVFRERLSRLLGNGQTSAANSQLERLDRTAEEIASAGSGDVDSVRTYQAGLWRSRVEMVLEGLDDAQRDRLAAEIRTVLEEAAGSETVNQAWTGSVTMTGHAADQARMYQLGQGTMNITDS
ncbi:hypothetical protein [Streptomyces sp. NPDC056982]|uniref:hypothetical protein n=1 Tax=Streptomyces sp. NPDC056982 TaxID=3345986 RepID=UPI00362E2E33